MDQPKRTLEELLEIMAENNKRVKIEKLESDDQGRLLLDRNNPHHVAWYEDYDPDLI